MATKFYNSTYDCFIDFNAINKASVIYKNKQVVVQTLSFIGTDIFSISPVEDQCDIPIEGVIIPDNENISFSGLFDVYGKVEITFHPVLS